MPANFTRLLATLCEGEVEFVLVGGYSAVLHGGTQMTRDIDIVCPLDEASGLRLVETLEGLNPVHRMLPHRREFVASDFKGGGLKNVCLRTDLGVLGCLSEVKGLGDFEACRARSQTVDLGDLKVPTLTIDALIEAKRAMGRPRDLVTAEELELIRSARSE